MDRTEQIWKIYHDSLQTFIQSRVQDASIADDILQDVFIRIHSRIGALKESGKIKSWIYQIARNAIIDHYRAHKMTGELREISSTPESDLTGEERERTNGCLLSMIESLSDPYRQALMLSEIEGLSQKEVAARQGLSLSGAKSRIQRGRSMMKKMLLQCCHFEFDRRGNVIDYEGKGCTCEEEEGSCEGGENTCGKN